MLSIPIYQAELGFALVQVRSEVAITTQHTVFLGRASLSCGRCTREEKLSLEPISAFPVALVGFTGSPVYVRVFVSTFLLPKCLYEL